MLPEELLDEETEDGTAVWSVFVYLVTREYGGPEEGGWWYNHSEPLDLGEAVDLGGEAFLPHFFVDEMRAIQHMAMLQHTLDATANKGRPSLSSVASTGRYEADIRRGHPCRSPLRRPTYE